MRGKWSRRVTRAPLTEGEHLGVAGAEGGTHKNVSVNCDRAWRLSGGFPLKMLIEQRAMGTGGQFLKNCRYHVVES